MSASHRLFFLGESMGKGGKGFSAVSSHGAAGVTRRQFLVAAASAPVAAALPDFSRAADAADLDLDADLIFILSDDEKTLTVHRADKDPTSGGKYQDWTLAAAAFGPQAWFDMDMREYAAGPSRRYFSVRNVSYGALKRVGEEQPLSCVFVFEQINSNSPADKVDGKANKVWKVGLETNIWSQSAAPKPFGGGKVELYRWLDPSSGVKIQSQVNGNSLNSVLASMFDSQISAVGNADVGLYPDLSWRIQKRDSDKAPPLKAFGGRVAGPSDAAGLKISLETRVGETGTDRRLAAECAANWVADLVIPAREKAPSAVVRPRGDRERAPVSGDLRVFELWRLSTAVVSGGRSAGSILAAFSVKDAAIDVACLADTAAEGAKIKSAAKETPLVSSLPLAGLSFTRLRIGGGTAKPPQGLWRIAAIADAVAPRDDKKKADAAGDGVSTATGNPAEGHGVKTVLTVDLQTLIGRLKVARLPLDQSAAPVGADSKDGKEGAKPAEEAKKEAERHFDALGAAALGDRSGVASNSFYLVADENKKAELILHRLYADVELHQADTALPDTRDSSLTFDKTHFRFSYVTGTKLYALPVDETPWAEPGGFLALVQSDPGSEAARISLDRAALAARRDLDLADLRFRFSGLTLSFKAGADRLVGGAAPTLRPSIPNCGVSVTPEGFVTDSRPILSVELPPQHVMEEAFFRLEPEPLPDLPWPVMDFPSASLGAFLQNLRTYDLAQDRAYWREILANAKVKQDEKKKNEAIEEAKKNGTPAPAQDPYEITFAELYSKLRANNNLPVDQQIYIGPYEMTPEAVRAARDWQKEKLKVKLDGIVTKLLADAVKVGAAPKGETWTHQELLAAEVEAEKQYPLYKLFRDAYRAYVIEKSAAGTDATKTDFFNSPRVPALPKEFEPDRDLLKDFRERFLQQISGQEKFERLAMARLSRPSRLSFSVNCQAVPGDSSEVNGLEPCPPSDLAAPSPSVQRFGDLPFTFEALTDWSRHEPLVTRRAQRLYDPLASGALPPVAGRVPSLDDLAILKQQGFTPGAKQAAAHLDEVRKSLLTHPENLETQIEIPARLILSTAQNAVWQTPRKVEFPEEAKSAKDEKACGPADAKETFAFEYGPQPLWAVRLLASDVNPGLRAVWSPDLRPEAVGFVLPPGAGAPRIAGAPPRGPWAPWVLRREQVDGVRVSPLKVAQAANGPAGSTDDEVCPVPTPEGITTIPNRTPTMFERVCEIFHLRAVYGSSDLHTFRTSLDAYDRHELVLLSSAHGLPVTGKRKQIAADDDSSGGLIEKSGQFEPGADFHLTDATKDLAYYRPKTLDVSELALSAIGGFFNHDTNFLPPAPALTYDGRPMFDGLSIERWQHQIVLGRDVLATVVYSGYLFPLGHKASLVKITERIFVPVGEGKAPEFGIKAVLRQRMFVRISTPLKKYPAVGQPNGGRQWCSENVTMLTRQTSDIIDPTFEIDPPEKDASLSGRIALGGKPGLAFWPQTALAEEARFRFEFMLDGRRTRMPLIFADRIAATNPDALRALVEYYSRQNADPWRTARLEGQTLRFAPSLVDGDTSFATERLILGAEGRKENRGATWEGENDKYANTGVLEGADQPPFYPVMKAAYVRLEQAERLSGSAMPPVRVRFDGHYVRNGLTPKKSKKAEDKAPQPLAEAGNVAEAFLYTDPVKHTNSIEFPELNMGPNGGQSGGVGRPALFILGLSRTKGLLGAAADSAVFRTAADSNAVVASLANLGLPDDKLVSIASVARHFSLPPPDAPAGAVTSSVKAAEAPSNYKSTFESFFSADAKLLGVIKFKDLMKLLALAGGIDIMPALKEAVEYGSQALARLNEGAADAVDIVRNDVLVPLLRLVQSTRAAWANLGAAAVKAQSGAVGQINEFFKAEVQTQSLQDLYPEIDDGLTALEEALNKAIAESDAIALTLKLGAVHQAGRQFMHELSLLAANPAERLELAVRQQLDEVLGSIASKVKDYEDAANTLAGALEGEVLGIATGLVGQLIAALPAEEIRALLEAYRDVTEVTDLIDIARGGLTLDLKSQEIQNKFKEQKAAVLQGLKDPQSALASAIEAVLKAATDNADVAIKGLNEKSVTDDIPVAAKTQLIDGLKAYKSNLAQAGTGLKDWLANKTPAPPRWFFWVAQVKRTAHLAELIIELSKTDDTARVFAILVEIGRDYLGIDTLAVETAIKDNTNKIEAWIGDIKSRLSSFASNDNGPPNPNIPPAVLAACLSQTPVPDDTGSTSHPAQDAAAAIAGALKANPTSPQHWLKPFANSVEQSHGVRAPLDAVAKNSASPVEVTAAAKSVLQALPKYRELFCELVVAVARAEQASTVLDTLAAPPISSDAPKKKLQLIQSHANDVRRGLARIQALLKELIDLLEPHTGVLIGAGGAAVAIGTWQEQAVAGLRTALNSFFRLTGVAASLTSELASNVTDAASNAVTSILPETFNPQRDALADALRHAKGEVGTLAKKIAKLRIVSGNSIVTFKDLLEADIDNANPPAALKDAFKDATPLARTDKIQAAFEKVGTAFDALEARIAGLPESAINTALDGPVEKLLDAVSAAYGSLVPPVSPGLLSIRNDLIVKSGGYPIGGPAIKNALLVPLLVPPQPSEGLKPDNDRLAKEQADASILASDPAPVTNKRQALHAFCHSISGGRAAVAVILENFRELWKDIARGNVAALVDISALRDEVEDYVSQLIPVKRTLKYDLDFAFDGDQVAKYTADIFQPKTPSRFTLRMKAEIDLIKLKAELKAVGHLGPFDIKLIGTVFDAVTLMFDGVDFEMLPGGSTRFDVHYRDFKIGPMLEFVKELQAYFTPAEDGSGFFIEPARGRPGIVAGYGLNLGTIRLGPITFSNVLLAAAVELPFDGTEALFRFSLGRLLAPFLISVAPYGGGGFIAIYANADGFRGFEASFSFGGVADFSAGPLVCVGVLQLGFYIQSMKVTVGDNQRTLTNIYGTFFVGGAANIWIFDFAASLYVQLGMKDGGEMEGIAIFTFSFSVGIVDYDFSITVQKSQPAMGGGGGGTGSIGQDNRTIDAVREPDDGIDRSITTYSVGAKPVYDLPNVEARTVPLSAETLDDYLAYFGPGLIRGKA
jgi:hypothetical protein